MANLRPTDEFMKRLMVQVSDDAVSEDDADAQPLTLAQRRFLEAYKNVGTVTGAGKASNSNRKSHYNWCRRSPRYRAAFIEAEMEARDVILEKCRKVAIEDESVPMLIHLSKGIFPELFATQRHELSGPNGSDINVKSTGSVDQILGRINDIVSRREQQAIDSQVGDARVLEGPEDRVVHSEE